MRTRGSVVLRLVVGEKDKSDKRQGKSWAHPRSKPLDNMMRNTYFRIMQLETLIQTRIPADAGQKVVAMATTEGLSIATWLRRLVLKEVNRMQIETWVDEKSVTTPPNRKAEYLLERVQDISATEVEFKLRLGPGSSSPGSSIDPNGLRTTEWCKKPNGYHFFLRGSLKPWSFVRSFYDNTSAGLLVVLRSE